MTDKPNLLAGYETEAEFAKRHDLSPRTVARYRNEPDGLPFMFWAGRIYIHLAGAADYMARRVRKPNMRRVA